MLQSKSSWPARPSRIPASVERLICFSFAPFAEFPPGFDAILDLGFVELQSTQVHVIKALEFDIAEAAKLGLVELELVFGEALPFAAKVYVWKRKPDGGVWKNRSALTLKARSSSAEGRTEGRCHSERGGWNLLGTASLLNLRRLDADALAGVGTDERELLLHAGPALR
jgi:hypothetical protein